MAAIEDHPESIKEEELDETKQLGKLLLNTAKIRENTDRKENRPLTRELESSESSGNGKASAKGEPVFRSADWLSDSELIFSLTNQVGGLVRALRIFQELDIGIKHVESRKSRRHDSEFEIFVDIDCSDKEKMRKLVHHLRHEVNCLTKEEFERLPNKTLVRQSSQMQSPLSSSLSFNEVIKSNSVDLQPDCPDSNACGAGLDRPAELADGSAKGANKALALMAQPSVDYGKFCFVPWRGHLAAPFPGAN